MDQNKLFVVILVISLIFIGIFFHLLFLDKRIRKLEKKIGNNIDELKNIGK